jgi:hypothetical protein
MGGYHHQHGVGGSFNSGQTPACERDLDWCSYKTYSAVMALHLCRKIFEGQCFDMCSTLPPLWRTNF